MRSPVVAFLATLAVGLVIVLISALGGSRLVYVGGATPAVPAVGLQGGRVVCQGPLELPDGARFEQVRLRTNGPAAPFYVTVLDDERRTLGRGRTQPVPRSAGKAADAIAPVGEITSDRPLEICVRGTGDLYGAPGIGSAQTATLDGVEAQFDLSLWLERDDSTPLLRSLGTVADRASLFKAGWVSPLTLALLGLILLVGVPALLVTVLRNLKGQGL